MSFDASSVNYDSFHASTLMQKRVIDSSNFTYRDILGILNEYLPGRTKVLDIGCGAGVLSLYLASKGKKVFGIDVSKKSISSCRQSAEYLHFKNIEFARMNFPREVPRSKFDLIICNEVLEHIAEDELALIKIHQMLTDKGVLVISVPSKNAPLYKMGMAKEFDKRVGHLRRYSEQEIVQICKKTGLEILKVKKTEGILRNFLFLNPVAGKSIRFIKFFISDVVSFIDLISLFLFGESNNFVVARKP
ncbi:class I SAM-dependent methyltransferase [Patescibacteria group bacterium]|nr:class I SAM-dependent methyltransferase [Patescibacteria group bacterium]